VAEFPVLSTTNIVIVLGDNSNGYQKKIITEKPEDLSIRHEEN